MSNFQKTIFLILFFIFLSFGFQALAALCSPTDWNKAGSCTVNITYTDPAGGSNLEQCLYKTENGVPPICTDDAWSSACVCSEQGSIACSVDILIGPTGDCNVNGVGTCKVCSKAVDGAGNKGYGEQSLDIDYTTPATTITCDGLGCSSSWYATNTAITLSCQDTDSGCDATYYCLDQTDACNPDPLVDGIECLGVFTLTTEGQNYVRFYSADNAGNTEAVNSQIVKLDKTGPVSQFTDVATPRAGSTVISDFDVSVNDWDRPDVDNSGLASCYYSIHDSGADWAEKSGETRNCNSDLSFTVIVNPGGASGDCRTIGGTCTVSVYAYDIAGNPGEGQFRTFNISETTPPVTTLDEYSPDPTNDNTPTYSGVSTDAQSNVVDIEYRVDGGSWIDVDSFTPALSVPFTFTPLELADGTYTFEVRAQDQVENWEQPPYPSDSLTIDTELPLVGEISPLSVIVNVAETFSADVSDNIEVTNCWLYIYEGEYGEFPGTYDGEMSLDPILCQGPEGCTASKSHTFTSTGDYSLYALCLDEAENYGLGPPVTVTVTEPGPTCNINVPDTGVINQWIAINVSGSQGAITGVRFSSDNNLNGTPDGSWDPSLPNYYDWTVSSGNWDTTNKTMKWSFAAVGTYEVWAEVKDGTGEFSQCYDTIIIVECWPGETKSCTSPQGCSHTITCQANGTWPACSIDECTANAPDSIECPCSGIDGCIGPDYYDYPAYGDCNSFCACNISTASGQPCAPTIYSLDPRCVGVDQCDSDADCNDGNPCTDNWCERPEDPDSICRRDNFPEGTDCGVCKVCDGSGNCINQPDGENDCGEGCQRCVSGFCQDYSLACGDGTDESSCECIDDVCRGCAEYYDPGGPTPGYGFCEYWDDDHYQIPVWSCVGGECQYDCEGMPPPGCTRKNPEVHIYPDGPWYGEGNPGDSIAYTVKVWNKDTGEECASSTFSLTTGDYCNIAGWTCSELPDLTILANNQHDSTTLTVTSPNSANPPPKGDKNISVTAQNTGFPEYFGTGYATYKALNNPPSATNLSATPIGVCFLYHPYVKLEWSFSDPDLASGDYQSAREVEIFSDSGYTNLVNKLPEPDFAPGSKIYVPNTGLDFNATYYWRVRVWDNEGALSDCGQPEGWCYSEQLSFHTEKEWPWPDFSVTPLTQRVHLKERVEFTDESTCYDGPCNLSPTANYLWEFGDGGTSLKQGNTSHIYLATGNYDVTLTITDEVGSCTSDPITITVTLPLPEWKEIAPF